MRDEYTCYLGATQIVVRLAPLQISSARQSGQLVSCRRFYASVYDNNFPSPVCPSLLPAMPSVSFSAFHDAARNLRPHSVTVPSHTHPRLRRQCFPVPAMPNARRPSLFAQYTHSFSFLLRPLRTAPSRFPNTIRLDNRPPLLPEVVSMLSHLVI